MPYFSQGELIFLFQSSEGGSAKETVPAERDGRRNPRGPRRGSPGGQAAPSILGGCTRGRVQRVV